MKRQWEPEELIEQFILTPAELAILPEEVTNASPPNRLGFAVLLKFFQVESRFPQHPVEIPKVVVAFIAQQLQLSEEDYRHYKWSGRTTKTHRAQIRTFLGFSSDKTAARLNAVVDLQLPPLPEAIATIFMFPVSI